MGPCLNPACKSHGKPHPNCQCYSNMAEGGEASHFCSKEQMHEKGCEYYADGGEVDFTPDSGSPQPGQTQPTQDSISFTPDNQEAADNDKYGSAGQQAITVGEGLAKGLAGPVATAAERAIGVKGEDIEGRARTNPTEHLASEAAGLIAPAVLSGGESLLAQGNLLGTAGKAAAEGLGLTGAKAVAAKLGVENALYSIGDEVSKAIDNNPNSIQTAAIHVGLSGLLGAGLGLPLGKASELWTTKFGPKAEQFAQDFATGLRNETTEGQALASQESHIAQGPFPNFPPKPGTPLFEAPAAEAAEEVAKPRLSVGEKAAQWVSKNANSLASGAIADSIGIGLGRMSHIPGGEFLGAMLGNRTLKPLLKTVIPSLINPILSTVASGEGLRAAFEAVNAVASGDALATKAAESLFTSFDKDLQNQINPDDTKVESLRAHVDEMQQNPSQLMDIGGHIGHYLPQHQTALAATSQNAINYLVASKPLPTQAGPLDFKVPPSASQEAAYERTLGIAEQPLVILQHLQNGTLHPKDMKDVQTLYPSLVPLIKQKVNNSLINHMSKEHQVPFKMRGGLSFLMGQPMDSSFTPQGIQSIQATFIPANPPPQGQQGGATKKGTSKMGKVAKMAQTPAEARTEALSKS